jgi:hypothetical protein
MDGYSSTSRPSLSGEAKINASSVRTKSLTITGNTTGANVSLSGVISGPTGFFTDMKCGNVQCTGLSGTNIYFNGSLIGPTGLFTSVGATNVNFTNTINGPTGVFTNISSTTSTLTNLHNTSMTGTNLYETNISYSGSLNGPSATYSNLSFTSGTGTTLYTSNIRTSSINTSTANFSGNVAFDTATLVVDSTNDRVGILTTSPTKSLEVVGDAYLNGSKSLFIGNGTDDSSSQKLRLHQSGSSAFVDITGDSKLSIRSGTSPATFFQFDNSGGFPFIRWTGGNFGIEGSAGTIYSDKLYNSTTSGTADLTISALAGYITRVSSSKKYKTDIEDIEDKYSEQIYKLRPVWYRSTCEMDNKEWSHYGLIAEEVDLIDKRMTTYSKDGEPEGIQWYKIIPLMIKEIQKLRQEVDALKAV